MTGRFVDISALLGSEFEAIQFLGVEEVEPFPHDDHEIIQLCLPGCKPVPHW